MDEKIIHIIFGISSFTLCFITVMLGLKTAGRFGKSKITRKTFKMHKFFSIITSIFVIISFSLGFIASEGFEFEFEFEGEGIHGITGLLAVLLILIQIIPSLIIKKRKKIRLIHRLSGYLLLIDLSYHLITGILRIA